LPEAAEVAVAAAQLHRVAAGRALRSLPVTNPRTVRHTDRAALQQLVGTSVAGVRSHGKWIVVDLDGKGDALGIHLRMSGQLLVADPGTPHPDRHVHATLLLGEIASVRQEGADRTTQSLEGVEVWFRDPRTFGELRVLAGGAPVAPDLFDPAVDGAALAASSVRRSVGVKAVLLDQLRAVSGIGSYLADEALHRVGISPLRPANRLSAGDWQRVLDAGRRIVDESSAAGGVTLPDEGWVDLFGRPGRYAQELRVHGLEVCATCGTGTTRAVVGGRSARWCPACQPD
jgi:formamidopyrimidine-DNA glycosylase